MTKRNPRIEVNSTHKTINNGDIVVTKYVTSKEVRVMFVDTNNETITTSASIRTGYIKDYMRPVVFGVGFFGVGDRKPKKKAQGDRCYTTWHSMIRRCYSSVSLKRNPTYKGCTVCDEWHNFQNFAKWFDLNYVDGMHLDKDKKISGNKVYSPSTCSFIAQSENTILSTSKDYAFLSPTGESVLIHNLAEFCRNNNLNVHHMCSVHGDKRRAHKGWTKLT